MYRALPYQEGAFVRAAAVGLVETWMGLRLLGFRRWKRIVVNRVAEGGGSSESARLTPSLSAERIAQLASGTARNLFLRTNCLEQSLVLWSLLRMRGYAADLKFGARKEAGEFEAHAWVEMQGNALGEDREEHQHYAAFDGAIAAAGTPAE
jgi:hypothetical protein